MHTLVCSDMHLGPDSPETNALFFDFIKTHARKELGCERVVLLGDQFEYWVGDDVPLPPYLEFKAIFKALQLAGIECLCLTGNRDFLMGQQFSSETGIQLLPENSWMDWYGYTVLLTHGDLLCLADKAYLRYRKVVRNPFVQWLYRQLPQSKRLKIADQMREKSRQATHSKPAAVFDVSDEAIMKIFAQRPFDVLLHGHIHRKEQTVCAVTDERQVLRLSLTDWHPKQGSFFKVNADGVHFHTYS